jgi:uncharacterized protein
MAGAQAHHLLLYDYVEDMLERRGPHREAHLEHIRAQRDAGHLLVAGAIGDPVHGGALVFQGLDPAEIEAFVRADPYLEAGLLTGWRIEPYHVV